MKPSCLIIGQGIAGAVLGWTLRRHGARVCVAHDPAGPASSQVAAGIVNPVTGKRYALSWRFAEFRDFARQTYAAMEREWNTRLWHEREIIRLLGTPEESNNWSARAALPEFGDFIGETETAGPWSTLIQSGHFLGRIRQAAQVDFTRLRERFLHTLEPENRRLQAPLHPETIPDYARDYDFIICCEGALAANNPLFPGLPWQLAKGEGLLVEIPALHASDELPMLKKDLVIASPGGSWGQLYWVGATYAWTFDDHRPTPAVREELADALARILRCPFSIRGHFAGVRPVVKDRRPLIGPSEAQPGIYIFNGFGSKGALLVPYWAELLAQHLLYGAALDPETDVRRFTSG